MCQLIPIQSRRTKSISIEMSRDIAHLLIGKHRRVNSPFNFIKVLLGTASYDKCDLRISIFNCKTNVQHVIFYEKWVCCSLI